MHYIIRLAAMKIENIKNVGYGRLEFSQGKSGSILGIYGQNGSGKTVVVDCMVLLKCLLSEGGYRLISIIISMRSARAAMLRMSLRSGQVKTPCSYNMKWN